MRRVAIVHTFAVPDSVTADDLERIAGAAGVQITEPDWTGDGFDYRDPRQVLHFTTRVLDDVVDEVHADAVVLTFAGPTLDAPHPTAKE